MERTVDRLRTAGPLSWPALLLYAGVAAAHVATIALARAIARTTTEGVPLWAAAGVSVAVLLLVPRRLWPGVLAAIFLSNVLGNLEIEINLSTSTVSALSNAVEPLVGALVVLHVLHRAPDLAKRRHLFVFLAGAAVFGPFVGALIGAGSTQLTPGHLEYLDIMGRWFTGDALGVLVVGSFILAWAQPSAIPRGVVHVPLEAIVAAGALVALAMLAFWGNSPVLAYIVLPPLAWASIRFGPRGATLGGLAVAVIADWATIRDHGLFALLASDTNNEALWSLQLFLAVVLVAALVLAAQVSELGEAERALRVSEEKQRFSSLLESFPDPVIVLRGDSTVAYLNEALVELADERREELVGRPFLPVLPQEHRGRVQALIEEVMQQPEGSRSSFGIGLGARFDRTLEIAVSPLDTIDGRVLVATVRDVTDRNAAEAKLREAVEVAEAATSAKTQFLATMSHEIRTPMSAVTSLIELLEHTPLDAEQQSLVNTMRSSSAALLRIIDDTLDFSKIEAGMLEFEAVPIAIDDEVRAIASLMEPAAATKGISLACSSEPAQPRVVLGDPVRIRQVLLNLVGNAIKFTSAGGVELAATVPDAEEDGSVDVTFVVRDTGIGIDEDRQAVLFRPFTQADLSTTRLYGGTGLGLSIVSRLIELMNGSVAVDSVPGEGSTFVVTLPLPTAPADAQPTRRPPTKPLAGSIPHDRIGGHVVLIAEDNAINRDLLCRQLAIIGCAADVVADGQQALGRLSAGGISLVLTDCHMPVLDGFALTRAIREAEQAVGDERLPVVAITANAMDGEGERCLAAGMDAYLTKPVDLGRLSVVLADLLPDDRTRPSKPVDLTALRQIVGDDDTALGEVLDTFAATVRTLAEDLRTALEAGDGAAVGAAAHRVVGAAAAVGADRLVSLARTVELGATTAGDGARSSAVAWMLTEIELIEDEVASEGAHRG